jgi:hypothetical protein
MNTINEVRFVENKVRMNNPEIKDKGDKYLDSVRTKKKARYDKANDNTDNNTDNNTNSATSKQEQFFKNFYKNIKTLKVRTIKTPDGDIQEYYSDSSSNSSQDNNKKRIVDFDKVFQRRRLQYVSALNGGKIKKVNVSKLYEYGIVFNEATGKYEKVNQGCPRNDPVNKLIEDNEDLWTDRFTPELIIQKAINERVKKYPEMKGLSNKSIFTTGFNPESILLTAIAIRKNKIKSGAIKPERSSLDILCDQETEWWNKYGNPNNNNNNIENNNPNNTIDTATE